MTSAEETNNGTEAALKESIARREERQHGFDDEGDADNEISSTLPSSAEDDDDDDDDDTKRLRLVLNFALVVEGFNDEFEDIDERSV